MFLTQYLFFIFYTWSIYSNAAPTSSNGNVSKESLLCNPGQLEPTGSGTLAICDKARARPESNKSKPKISGTKNASAGLSIKPPAQIWSATISYPFFGQKYERVLFIPSAEMRDQGKTVGFSETLEDYYGLLFYLYRYQDTWVPKMIALNPEFVKVLFGDEKQRVYEWQLMGDLENVFEVREIVFRNTVQTRDLELIKSSGIWVSSVLEDLKYMGLFVDLKYNKLLPYSLDPTLHQLDFNPTTADLGANNGLIGRSIAD
ncbi:MAG: hypothetical protein M1829_003297 [Trizodia sp. TS-e1964]|nr:MAG: hypothetical protein M1829_003297 [Trizodia sp. TS-e1964]